MKHIIKGMQDRFDQLVRNKQYLFEANVSQEDLWRTYITNFSPDPIFRDPNSTVHTCKNCRNFVTRYGAIIIIDQYNKKHSIWDVPADEEHDPVFKALHKLVIEAPIRGRFLEDYDMLVVMKYTGTKAEPANAATFQLGVAKNVKQYTAEEAAKFGRVEPGQTCVFEHWHLHVPNRFVVKNAASILSDFHSGHGVLLRGLKEISMSTLELVKDLILQGSLLNGTTHLQKVERFMEHLASYNYLPEEDREAYVWNIADSPYVRFRNELIGTLCMEIEAGDEIETVCLNWNKRADPLNYMKANSPITKGQIKQAQQFVEENGYEASFTRRLATLDDISIAYVHHVNNGTGTPKPISIFDGVKAAAKKTGKKASAFEKVEEVHIDEFMRDIMPRCTRVEVFLETRHERNLMTLTAPSDVKAKPIFKWDNGIGWTYKGNISGKSQIAEAVKERGGTIDAFFRASLIWNQNGLDASDLDLWVKGADTIGFSTMYRKDRGVNFVSPHGGQLDLDNTSPNGKLAVENIYYRHQGVLDGSYQVLVDPYHLRNFQHALECEVYIDGSSYRYRMEKAGKVATVVFKNGNFVSIQHHATLAEETIESREMYGLLSGEFHPTSLVCTSPNHWGKGVGDKHYFFILADCKANSDLKTFHPDQLNSELQAHRKVLDVLAHTTMIKAEGPQLSGLGFNATMRDNVVLKLDGSFQRVIRLTF